MAYTLPNTGVIQSPRGNKIIHRRLVLTCPTPTATITGTISIPGPGRLVAIRYGGPNTTESRGAGTALTSGSVTLKAETTAGVQIFTDADLSSVPTRPLAVGTTAKDEGNAATAATDGFSGGFPVRKGVFVSFATGTAGEQLVVDAWFKLSTWVKLDLYPTGVDGSAAATRTVRLHKAGVLSAIAVDYFNQPATTDLTIKADGANGNALFAATNNNTDIAPTLLGAPGADEAINASAATDGTECPNVFMKDLYIAVAQGDGQTSGDEHIVMELWIDD